MSRERRGNETNGRRLRRMGMNVIVIRRQWRHQGLRPNHLRLHHQKFLRSSPVPNLVVMVPQEDKSYTDHCGLCFGNGHCCHWCDAAFASLKILNVWLV